MDDVTLHAKLFFDILPADWQANIVPFWDQYQNNANVYVLKKEGEICAGGIIFYTVPPVMNHFKKEAEHWLKLGYHYIGFVWVPEAKRNRSYGSAWLGELKKLKPGQKFWLLTEEKTLKTFYIKNGFRYVKTLFYKKIEEDLFVSEVVQ